MIVQLAWINTLSWERTPQKRQPKGAMVEKAYQKLFARSGFSHIIMHIATRDFLPPDLRDGITQIG
ncbi:MAG: hypothetical protein VKJ04_00635 [Vampirovibrionales bacterium]|nr:hypothetical protein [Vampirovibrionales bacterium]